MACPSQHTRGRGAQEDLPGEFETCGDLRTGAVLMTQQASCLGKDISPQGGGSPPVNLRPKINYQGFHLVERSFSARTGWPFRVPAFVTENKWLAEDAVVL